NGTSPILVRAAGYALLRSTVDVPPGGSATFAAVLAPEPALAGHVRDALGAPVRDALVQVGDDSGPFLATARSGDDGGLRVGELAARVESTPGRTRTTIHTQAGRTETWEAVLEPELEIRGRVLDERGQPLAGWSLQLFDQVDADEPDQAARASGLDGSFVFANVHDRPHSLSLHAP